MKTRRDRNPPPSTGSRGLVALERHELRLEQRGERGHVLGGLGRAAVEERVVDGLRVGVGAVADVVGQAGDEGKRTQASEEYGKWLAAKNGALRRARGAEKRDARARGADLEAARGRAGKG